jgi:alpha-amylase
VCEHRDPAIEAMVGFRHVVAGTAIADWWDDGANAIAFSRGAKGFVAISRESSAVDTTVATAMTPGNYCDLLTGGLAGTTCAGGTVVVDSTSRIHLQLAANSAIAIDAASRK